MTVLEPKPSIEGSAKYRSTTFLRAFWWGAGAIGICVLLLYWRMPRTRPSSRPSQKSSTQRTAPVRQAQALRAKAQPAALVVRKTTKLRFTRHVINQKLKGDPNIEALVRPFRQRLERQMLKVLATLPKDLPRRRPESGIGNMVADLCLVRLRSLGQKVDVFITNLGGIRKDLGKGKLTLGDVYEVLPFDNALATFSVKGSTIKKAFNALARKKGEPLAGARMKIDPKRQMAFQISIGGKPLKLDRSYMLGTSDYLSETGWLAPILKGVQVHKTGVSLRDAVIWALRHRKKRAQFAADGRVKIAPAPSPR